MPPPPVQAQLASVGAKLQESEGRVKTLESEAAALKTDVESSGTAASREMAGLKVRVAALWPEGTALRPLWSARGGQRHSRQGLP